jgi:hypothetical protein
LTEAEQNAFRFAARLSGAVSAANAQIGVALIRMQANAHGVKTQSYRPSQLLPTYDEFCDNALQLANALATHPALSRSDVPGAAGGLVALGGPEIVPRREPPTPDEKLIYDVLNDLLQHPGVAQYVVAQDAKYRIPQDDVRQARNNWIARERKEGKEKLRPSSPALAHLEALFKEAGARRPERFTHLLIGEGVEAAEAKALYQRPDPTHVFDPQSQHAATQAVRVTYALGTGDGRGVTPEDDTRIASSPFNYASADNLKALCADLAASRLAFLPEGRFAFVAGTEDRQDLLNAALAEPVLHAGVVEARRDLLEGVKLIHRLEGPSKFTVPPWLDATSAPAVEVTAWPFARLSALGLTPEELGLTVGNREQDAALSLA